MSNLFAVPLELKEANSFVKQHHRHHKPCVGHRFSIGAMDAEGVLRGAVIVGRPVARLSGSPRDVLEVTRLVTDGTVVQSQKILLDRRNPDLLTIQRVMRTAPGQCV